MKFAVIGCGMQGVAAAWYLATRRPSSTIYLYEKDKTKLNNALRDLNYRISKTNTYSVFKDGINDINSDSFIHDLVKIDGVVSAATFKINEKLTEMCIATNTHMVDLGGNTEVVKKQESYFIDAFKQGVVVAPDLGLAPGLGNILASHLIAKGSNDIKIYCGGLPVEPVGPLGYKLVFSAEGLINEYFEDCWTIENHQLTIKEGFTEVEELTIGGYKYEAFHTSGGSSNAPWNLSRNVENYEYKTLRWPGHHKTLSSIKELGLLDDFIKSAEDKLSYPHIKDKIVLKVIGDETSFEMFVGHDKENDFTAMAQATAYPAAQVLLDAVNDEITPGVYTPDILHNLDVEKHENYLKRLINNSHLKIQEIDNVKSTKTPHIKIN